MKKYLLIFLIVVPLFSICLVGAQVYYLIDIWKYDGPDKTFIIKDGEGFSKINYRLKKEDLISNAKIFHRYSQINDYLTKFKAGEYVVKKNSNMLDIFEILLRGKSLTIKITIPEGKNIFEVAKILEAKNISNSKSFIKVAKSEEFTKELNIPASRIEGYLYPDTYQFSKNTAPKYVIKKMVRTFREKTKSLDFSNTFLTPHQIIVLASIVEKETGAAWERPMIAGLYLNRLKKKMRLQADPTTIYGIFENYNGNLRSRHLKEKTPYNTYRINGLPAGPISNPGIDSIKAVLNPESHSYIYFVSKNDGTHKFTATYKEHLQAVNKWQRNRKNRTGKSWRDLKK
jgi:UPF0755 protein